MNKDKQYVFVPNVPVSDVKEFDRKAQVAYHQKNARAMALRFLIRAVANGQIVLGGETVSVGDIVLSHKASQIYRQLTKDGREEKTKHPSKS